MDANIPTSEFKFLFINHSNEDYYLLKHNTPFEGIGSNFLAVQTLKQKKEVEYIGPVVGKRSPDDFLLLKSEKETKSPISFNLSEFFHFPHAGKYRLRYTQPLIIYTNDEMGLLKKGCLTEMQRRHKNHHSFLVECFKDKPMPPKVKYEDEDELSTDCLTPKFIGSQFVSLPKRATTKALHHELISPNGYPRAIKAVDENPALFAKWFGSSEKEKQNKVKTIYQKCYDGLKKERIQYEFEDSHHNDKIFCYTHLQERKIVLHPLYDAANKKSHFSGDDSKVQILVHTLARMFGDIPCSVYGAEDCEKLAEFCDVENAENYGYFYCDVMCKRFNPISPRYALITVITYTVTE